MESSKCPGCGASVPPDADRCPYCKQYFRHPSPAAPSGAAERSGDPASAEGLWVVFTLPEDRETDVDPSLDGVEIVFSQPVKQNSWSFVTTGEGAFPELGGDPTFPEPHVCVLPVRLEPGTTYGIGVNSERHQGFASAADERVVARPYKFRFTTGT